MTIFRRRVLEAVAKTENCGSIETAIALYGYPTALQMHNVQAAMDWLSSRSFIDASGPTLTDKGNKAIAATEAR